MTTLGTRLRSIPSWQVTFGLALLVLGFLIAAQVSSEGPRVRYTTQQRPPLVQTALDLQAEQEGLKARVLELNDEIRRLQLEDQGSAATVKDVNDRLEEARVAAGLVSLEGTGIVLQLDDAAVTVPPGASDTDYLVSGLDIRTVVEEVWLAGAEAIAVNGERLTPSSAILDIGGSILVNSAYLAPPYRISAIGPDDLFDHLSASSGFVDFLRVRSEAFGIGVSVAEPESVMVPAFAGSVTIRFARTPQPSPSPSP